MNGYKLKQISEITARDNVQLPVYHGWDDMLASRLVEQSRQAEILKWTPRDAAERFRTMSTAERWYGSLDKLPIVYALGLTATKLPGFAWFSIQQNQEAPGAHLTFGIRMYDGYTGQGLARPFAQVVHDHMDEQYGAGVWLETDVNNSAARRLYDHLGYAALGKITENRILMAREPANLL